MFSRILGAFLLCFILISVAGAEGLDKQKYIGVDELRPGMSGIGKTVLKGSEPVEFFVELLAIVRNWGPKQDVLIVRLSGAGLGKTGIIEGMSGSPVYFDGRLAGAVAFAWSFGKEPIGGVQPIENMLRITDEHPWKRDGKAPAPQKTALTKVVPPALMSVGPRPLAPKTGLPAAQVSAAMLGLQGELGEKAARLRPIRTPVAVSGARPPVVEFLRKQLAPFGLVPLQAGGAGGAGNAGAGSEAKLAPGFPLCISLMTGDLDLTASGTVTEVVGNKVYGFGHSFFAMGEADYPMSTGRALFVFPSQYISFRMVAPVKEVGRLTWDEGTGVFGRVGAQERARMVPVKIEVLGPDEKARVLYRYQIVHHRWLSSSLLATALMNSILAKSDLPPDVTIKHDVRIEIEGGDPIILKNLSSGPMSLYSILYQVMGTTSVVMDNVFKPLRLKSVSATIQIIPKARLARIRSVRVMRNAVRPGQSMPIEIIFQIYKGKDLRVIEEVPIPQDVPNGTYRLTVCGASEALRAEMSEMPNRYNPRSVDDMLWILRRDEAQDNLFLRFHLPTGTGLAVEGDELPNLPESMRKVLGQSVREVSRIRQPKVVRKQMDMLIGGYQNVMIPVSDRAPKE